jgi:predicted RNA-binding protein YlqC (UPF0109 family)
MATETDKEFLEFLVKSIVDHPEDVKIDRKVDEMGVLLTLLVNPKDMGQVVGRGGSTAKAIRSLLRIVGIKHNARVNLKIEEPEGSDRRERSASVQEEAKTETETEDEPKKTGVTTTVDQVIDDIKSGL